MDKISKQRYISPQADKRLKNPEKKTETGTSDKFLNLKVSGGVGGR